MKKRLFFRSWWKHQTYQTHPRRNNLKNPPRFIGNATALIVDPDYLMLSIEQRGILHGLILLASYDAGHIDAEPAKLAAALRVQSTVNIDVFSEWLVPCEAICEHMPEGFDSLGQRWPSSGPELGQTCASPGPDHKVNVKVNVKVEGEEKLPTAAPPPPGNRRPAKRNHLDQTLTDLIDFFRLHPERATVYVPKWGKDKTILRPYVLAKGEARVREMLDHFVRIDTWTWKDEDFNAQCVRNAPCSIAGFAGIADRLDRLMVWDSKELHYAAPEAKKSSAS